MCLSQLNILPEYFVVQLADIKVDTVTHKQKKVVGGSYQANPTAITLMYW